MSSVSSLTEDVVLFFCFWVLFEPPIWHEHGFEGVLPASYASSRALCDAQNLDMKAVAWLKSGLLTLWVSPPAFQWWVHLDKHALPSEHPLQCATAQWLCLDQHWDCYDWAELFSNAYPSSLCIPRRLLMAERIPTHFWMPSGCWKMAALRCGWFESQRDVLLAADSMLAPGSITRGIFEKAKVMENSQAQLPLLTNYLPASRTQLF